MEEPDLIRVMAAIALSSSKGETPSERILAVLDDFVRAKKFQEAAEAFFLFQRAHRSSSVFVRGRIPKKIVNGYILKDGRIDTATFLNWSKSSKGKGWDEQIKTALATPSRFEDVVVGMRDRLIALKEDAAA